MCTRNDVYAGGTFLTQDVHPPLELQLLPVDRNRLALVADRHGDFLHHRLNLQPERTAVLVLLSLFSLMFKNL